MLKRIPKKRYIPILTILLLFIPVITLADSSFVDIGKTDVIQRDKFVGAKSLRNEGTIKGDLIFGAQDIWSTGTVEGDIIGAGSELTVNGPVLGNVRVAGGTINLGGTTGKNVNLFGGVININKNSEIGGNLLILGGEMRIDGVVKGYTHIGGGEITLNGEFFGDVDVNTGFGEEIDRDMDKDIDKDTKHKVKLTVLPGTVIHGRLKYRGQNLNIEQGAQIGDVEWIKPNIKPGEKQRREITETIWSFIRMLFGTAVYFLIGWAFYKLFPGVFRHQGELIAAKPINVAGVGLIGLVSTLVSLVIFIILLVLSVLINPGIGLIFGTAMTFGYILLFYFSTIPVALWLGNQIQRKSLSIPYRFGVGLATITLSLFILKLLAKLPVVGLIFPTLSFIIIFGILIMGTGALLFGVKELIRSARDAKKL